MPAAVAAYAVTAALSTTAVGALAVGIGTITVAQIAGTVVGLAVSSAMASSAASQQQSAIEASSRLSYNASLRDVTMIIDNPIVPRNIIFGEARTSGPLWPWFTYGPVSQYHTFGVILAGHECEAITDIYFNEDLLTLDAGGNVIAPAKYVALRGVPLFTITKFLGQPGQGASGILINAAAQSGNPSAWDASRIGTGLCYLVITMAAEFDVLGDIGVPKVSAIVRGVKAKDLRTGVTAWTKNPAALARWFMVDSPYSPKTDATEIDEPEDIASANVCDELVAFSATRNEHRYECNGILTCAESPLVNLQHILASMDGDALPIGGKWQLVAGYYKAPTLTIDESCLSGDDIDIAPYTQKSDLFNMISGTFLSPAYGYQEVSYQDVTSETYQLEDGDEVLPQQMNFVLVNDDVRCQMIAWQRLARARNGQTLSLGANFKAYDTSPLKNVSVHLAQLLGDSTKVFSVRKRDLVPPRLQYTLQETGPEVWAWDYTQAGQPVDIANTSFPDVTVLPVPGAPAIVESLYQTSGSVGVRSVATVSWVCLQNVYLAGFLVEYKLGSDLVWTPMQPTTLQSIPVEDLAPGIYNFRVRSQSTTGRRGNYSPITTKEILGLTAPPANITGLTVVAIAGRANASWDLSQDLDVRIGGRIIVRHTPLTTGAIWENGVILSDFNGDATGAQLDLLTGTYMVKALDSTGNYSSAMVAFVATESQVTGFTTVATLAQAPGFTGTKTSAYVDSNTLRIGGATAIDSMLGPIDTWGFVDNLGGVASSGTYDFNGVFNFGAVLSRRLSATIQMLAYDAGDLIDDRGPIDDWGIVDGGVINDVDATLYYRTTQTDPAGSPVWSAWTPFMTADVTCWGVQLRLVMTSGSPTHNAAISTLTVVAKSSP